MPIYIAIFFLHLNKICIHSKSIIFIKMSNFLSRQAKKEQDFFLNILRGSKKGKEKAGPYPKESSKKSQRKGTSRQTTPEGSGSVRQPEITRKSTSPEGSRSVWQPENPSRRSNPLFRDITEEFAHSADPQVIIAEGAGTEAIDIIEAGSEASSDFGETGASQEIKSRKRKRDNDDGIFN